MAGGGAPSPRDPLLWLIAGATTFVWTGTAVSAIATGDFRVFEVATGPYLLVVGAVTGIKVFRRNGNGGKKEEDVDDRWSHLE